MPRRRSSSPFTTFGARHFRLCRDADGGCATAAIVVIVGLAGLAKLALRRRLASDQSGIGNNGGRTRAALLRPSGRLRATTLRAAQPAADVHHMVQGGASSTALATGFRLRHTLGSFFLGFAARFSFRFQARFLFPPGDGQILHVPWRGAHLPRRGAWLPRQRGRVLPLRGSALLQARGGHPFRAATACSAPCRNDPPGADALCLLAAGALMHRALLRDMRLRYRSRRGCGRLRCRGLSRVPAAGRKPSAADADTGACWEQQPGYEAWALPRLPASGFSSGREGTSWFQRRRRFVRPVAEILAHRCSVRRPAASGLACLLLD